MVGTTDIANDGAVYLDDPRSEVAILTPPGQVLDVGCSRGAFGAELKRLQPTRKVFGIEPTDAVLYAHNRLDGAVQGFFPDDLPPDWGPFDIVCFNDVLEHTADPWTLLAGCATILAPGGRVVASIPNVRYINVLLDLVVRGEWRYAPTGVLDYTHLRFFTRQSIVELVEGAGFVLESVTPTHIRESSRLVARILRLARLGNRFQNVLAQRYVAIGRLL